jgi:hypothetical protein
MYPAPNPMTPDIALSTLALCVLLACSETLHGIARIKFAIPRLGKERAIKLSALTGSLLALLICFFLVPGIGLQTTQAHLVLGAVLALFMASFDIAIGKWLMHKSWAKIWPDFNPATGNYLLFGLAFLVLAPALVQWLRAAI